MLSQYILSFAKEGPDCRRKSTVKGNLGKIVEKRTMNVAAFATSEPQVSTMISSVRALDPTSIPLFTKIKSGRFSGSITGRKVLSIPLMQLKPSVFASVALTSETELE